MSFRVFICGLLFFFTCNLLAEPQLAADASLYYGPNLKVSRTTDIKDDLHTILNGYHISQSNAFDSIVKFCSVDQNENCYVHRGFSYKEARKFLFGFLHLETNKAQNYFVKTLYCQEIITNDNLPSGSPLGPMLIPEANIVNTEHSWPQSRFTNNFSKGLQKSDLHALYPVRMKVNSTRGNYPFGIVTRITNKTCKQAALGKDSNGKTVFEPSDVAKGNVARSLFYFSTRYKIKIDPDQEKYLREWHRLDPVDQDEIQRNQEIFEIQYVRNPYIDRPDWVDQVENF